MEISISPSGLELNVKVVGAVAEKDGQALAEAFGKIGLAKQPNVNLDLTQVPIITSTGIGKLILLVRKLEKQGGRFNINAISDNLYSIFTAISLDRVVTIKHDSRATNL